MEKWLCNSDSLSDYINNTLGNVFLSRNTSGEYASTKFAVLDEICISIEINWN